MKNAKSEQNLNTCENVKTLQELLEVSGVRTAPRRRLSMNTTADQDRACFAARYCCRHPKKAPKTRGCNDLPIAVKAPRRSRANHSVSRRKASACFCCSASQRSSRCRVTSCCKTARNVPSVASSLRPREQEYSRYARRARRWSDLPAKSLTTEPLRTSTRTHSVHMASPGKGNATDRVQTQLAANPEGKTKI